TMALAVAGVVLLMPQLLLGRGLIAPGGRAVSALATGRLLGLTFAIVVWGIIYRLIRPRSATVTWLIPRPEDLGWLGRRRVAITGSLMGGVGLVIGLDAAGYCFTAQRLAVASGHSVVLLGLCRGAYLLLLRVIDAHAWRWDRVGRSDRVGAADTATRA